MCEFATGERDPASHFFNLCPSFYPGSHCSGAEKISRQTHRGLTDFWNALLQGLNRGAFTYSNGQGDIVT